MFESKTKPQLLRIPKVLSILYILILAYLSLDVFYNEMPILQLLTRFTLQMVPTFILSIITIVAWYSSKIGGILFIAAGITVTLLFDTLSKMSHFFSSSFVLILIGVLFLLFGVIDE